MVNTPPPKEPAAHSLGNGRFAAGDGDAVQRAAGHLCVAHQPGHAVPNGDRHRPMPAGLHAVAAVTPLET